MNHEFERRKRLLDAEAKWARARYIHFAQTGVDINTLSDDDAAEAIRDIYPTGGEIKQDPGIARIEGDRFMSLLRRSKQK